MTENFVDVDQGKLWTKISGTSTSAIILCNGGPGAGDYLEPVAGMMDDLVRVIRFEPRGCGRSTRGPDYNMERALADMEAIRKYYNIPCWIAGGHSFGANLALAYAAEYPSRTKALLYLSGNGVQDRKEWKDQYRKNRKEIGEEIPEVSFNREVNRRLNASWKKYIKNPRFLKSLPQLNMPALFVYGSHDIRPSWPARQLAELLPNAIFKMIEEAPHYIWLTHREELQEILRDFLANIKET